MTADPRGRWFRVYARQVRDHDKFKVLNIVELGAWTALRSEAELRDEATFADRSEAVLILRRRKTPRPATVLQRLIGLHLFDEQPNGTLTVHDRAENDRSDVPPDQQRHRRDHRRSDPTDGCEWCLVERWDRSIGKNGAWTPVESGVDVDISTSTGRGLPQPAAPANSQQPAAPATGPQAGELPDESDPVTEACRYLPNGGQWLSDPDYRVAWDDLVRRFGGEWVSEAIPAAYTDCLKHGKVRPWDLKRMAEWHLAQRSRAEELADEKRRQQAERERAEAHRRAIEEATPEQREQAEYQRRAIRISIDRGIQAPTDPTEVRAFVEKYGTPQLRVVKESA